MTPYMVDLVRALVQHLPMEGSVLEVGSYIETNQDHLNLRQAFPDGTPYLGVDVNAGPGVDRTTDILDLSQVMNVVSEFSPRVTLCLYVLEHVWEIHKAVRSLAEIWRMHPESWLLVSTHQNQPFHGTVNYPDYWRITSTGLRRLMVEAGIPDPHVYTHPDATNPSDVLAIRQPNSMQWPSESIERALKTIPEHWEQCRR